MEGGRRAPYHEERERPRRYPGAPPAPPPCAQGELRRPLHQRAWSLPGAHQQQGQVNFQSSSAAIIYVLYICTCEIFIKNYSKKDKVFDNISLKKGNEYIAKFWLQSNPILHQWRRVQGVERHLPAERRQAQVLLRRARLHVARGWRWPGPCHLLWHQWTNIAHLEHEQEQSAAGWSTPICSSFSRIRSSHYKTFLTISI